MKYIIVSLVAVTAVFSPAVSHDAEAQFACYKNTVTAGSFGLKIICDASGNPFPDNACGGACTTDNPVNTCKQLPPGDECGDTLTSSGGTTVVADKEGNFKGKTISEWVLENVLWAIVKILEFINSMLVVLVKWTSQLFDATVGLSLAGLRGIDAVQIGWTITRDVANLFFIFGLLVIAIATILRLEQYGAKALLARLIIIALLINFSLVIAAAVVDASNILALAFINEIHPVSDHIVTVLDINKIRKLDSSSVEWRVIPKEELTSAGFPEGLDLFDMQFTPAGKALQEASLGTAPNIPDSLVAEFFFQVTILILLLVLVFVFISLAALLMIRSVALIIIFVLAPLGFFAGIFPQTRGFSTQWWQKLFYYSFFFPASAFMIYLAIQYGAQMGKLFGPGATQTMNAGLLFNYFSTVAFLVGALLVAHQMGIVGASAAIGLGLKATKKARGYAWRKSKAGVFATGRTAARATGPAAGAIAGALGAYGLTRVFAKPFAKLQATGEEAKKGREEVFTNALKQSDATFQARYAAAVLPQERAVARQAAVDNGKANLLSKEDRITEYQRATREHDNKALRNIEAVDPSVAATASGLTGTPAQEAINRAVAGLSPQAFTEKLNGEALKDEMVQNAILVGAGEKQLEAGVQRFGADFTDAIQSAYGRLSGAMGTPEAIFNELYDKNSDVLKTINQNPAFAAALPGVRAEISSEARRRNDQAAEDAATDARAKVLGASGTPAEAEIAAQNARSNAHRVKI